MSTSIGNRASNRALFFTAAPCGPVGARTANSAIARKLISDAGKGIRKALKRPAQLCQGQFGWELENAESTSEGSSPRNWLFSSPNSVSTAASALRPLGNTILLPKFNAKTL